MRLDVGEDIRGNGKETRSASGKEPVDGADVVDFDELAFGSGGALESSECGRSATVSVI